MNKLYSMISISKFSINDLNDKLRTHKTSIFLLKFLQVIFILKVDDKSHIVIL